MFARGNRKPVEEYFQKRHSQGTTVTVVDFMYNLPVRKRLINPTLDMEEIRNAVVAIALSNPHISFTLRNETKGEKVLQTNQSPSPLRTFQAIFGDKGLVEVEHLSDKYSIRGFIATEGSPRKDRQFLYVKRRFVRHSKLLKLVNNHFKKSIICRQIPNRFMDKNCQDAIDSSPSKIRKIYPIFYLAFECPFKEVDMTFEPRKTEVEFEHWDQINKFFEEALLSFLKNNKLLAPGLNHSPNRGHNPPLRPPDCHMEVVPNITGIVPLEATGNQSKEASALPMEPKVKPALENLDFDAIEGARQSLPIARRKRNQVPEEHKFLATSTPFPRQFQVNTNGVFVKNRQRSPKPKCPPISIASMREQFQVDSKKSRLDRSASTVATNHTITSGTFTLNEDSSVVTSLTEGEQDDGVYQRSYEAATSPLFEACDVPLPPYGQQYEAPSKRMPPRWIDNTSSGVAPNFKFDRTYGLLPQNNLNFDVSQFPVNNFDADDFDEEDEQLALWAKSQRPETTLNLTGYQWSPRRTLVRNPPSSRLASTTDIESGIFESQRDISADTLPDGWTKQIDYNGKPLFIHTASGTAVDRLPRCLPTSKTFGIELQSKEMDDDFHTKWGTLSDWQNPVFKYQSEPPNVKAVAK